MQIVESRAAMRALTHAWRAAGESVALVPTMGNLHAGHLALVERARELGRRVVASVFVNPLQFGPREDFAAYPRTLEADAAQLRAHGVDALFAPPLEEVYRRPAEQTCRIEVPRLGDILCGAHRPGHFDGVATVVAKLFNMVAPDVAVFGEKDFQQLLVIRRLVEDLDFPVRIEGVATVREADGLALSSRNAYLSAEERGRAPQLHAALCAARAALREGRRDYETLEAEGLERLRAAGFAPDYFSIRGQGLEPAAEADGPLVVLAAARLGRARLIDNLRV